MSALTEYLERHKNDKGLMADLRCALIESKRRKAWPHLAYFGGLGDDFGARIVQVVAGLYANHHTNTETGNMGDVFYRLLSDDERKGMIERGTESHTDFGPVTKRFVYLLAANGEEIFDRLTRVVFYAKQKDVGIPYQTLERDLKKWEYDSDRVKTEWAKSFWNPRRVDKEGV
ncbi:MAG: type I-E CRISPR-associated protein Cse2/CasB [Brevinematales bacterium]|nr:type I-E CRISPR-associated protein Cse2/CasB [Brevinematales bacterium]